MSGPLVAIVGAPNVGKSTLFNRLVGRRQAIVTDRPGVTRDRLYGRVDDVSVPFRLVDTGGLTPNTQVLFAEAIERQADAALEEAALTLFVVDVRAGVTATDRDVADRLRRRGRPVLVVANKVDHDKHEPLAHELYDLGLGEAAAVSAEHGRGVAELVEAIAARLRGCAAAGEPEATEAIPRVAIVGRPNVGKSSLLNRLLGEERVLVSSRPGTTRDAVDTLLTVGERRYLLVDTAGLRRRGRARERAEAFAVTRARRAIEEADVGVLVLDAAAGFAAQDAHIAGYVRQAHKPLLVAVNKWDLVAEREDEAKRWREEVHDRLRFAKEVPVLWISALTGQRVLRILGEVDRLYELAGKRIATPALNRWLEEIGRVAGGPLELRFLYVTQTGVHPPRFVVFCNDARRVHFSLRRRLENGLRRSFDFGPAPLRLSFRSRR